MKTREEITAKSLEICDATNFNAKTFTPKELFLHSVYMCLFNVSTEWTALYNTREGIIAKLGRILNKGIQFGLIDNICEDYKIESPNISRLLEGASISLLGNIASLVWILDDVGISKDPTLPDHPFVISVSSRLEYIEEVANAYGLVLEQENSSVVGNILNILINNCGIGISSGVRRLSISED